MTKELEALDRLYENLNCNDYFFRGDASEDCNLIETALKAFEIIKEKEVDIHNFKEVIIKQNWTYEQYLDEENAPNTSGHQFAYKLLTQEEYDLLREVLL